MRPKIFYLEERIAKYMHQLYNSHVQGILSKSAVDVNNGTLTPLHIAMENNPGFIVCTLLGCPNRRLDVQSELYGQVS